MEERTAVLVCSCEGFLGAARLTGEVSLTRFRRWKRGMGKGMGAWDGGCLLGRREEQEWRCV